MDRILSALSDFKLFQNGKVRIDSRICEIHYRFSVMLLLTFSFVITISELFGSPINCIQSGATDKRSVPEKFMNTYCYSLDTHIYINETRSPLNYPGVVGKGHANYFKHQSSYKWVFFMLLLHMFTLLTPHYVWKQYEGGLMSKLIKTNENYLVKSPTTRSHTFKKISWYIVKRHRTFYVYSYTYLLNYLFNTVAVCFNIFIAEKLLQGYFKYLGIRFVEYFWQKPSYLMNPLDIIFPKMTKCSFPKWGPSGSIIELDAMCLMPLNNFHEKFFIILWFWYLLLLCMSICNSLMKLIQWLSIYYNIKCLMKRFFDLDCIDHGDMEILQQKLDMGQWFVIDIVRLNLCSPYYSEFILSLTSRLQYKKQNHLRNGVMCNGSTPNGHVGHGDGTEA